jgi:hypothetical protein
MSEYEKQANDFAKKHKVTLKIKESKFDKHFDDDEKPRWCFKCQLSREMYVMGPKNKPYPTNKRYTFWFGQSYSAGIKNPRMYDILSCMTKYDPGTFEDFCREFGYYTRPLSEYPKVMKIYQACQKEYEAMQRMFPEEKVFEELCEIQ